MDVLTFPSARAIAIGYLSTVLDGVTVLATLPDDEYFDEALPIVRVSQVGGIASRHSWSNGPTRDEPVIDIDLYGPLGPVEAEAAMDALTKRTRAAVASMKGHIDRTEGGVVTRSYEIAGPAARPEENPNVIRVGFTAGLAVRPL